MKRKSIIITGTAITLVVCVSAIEAIPQKNEKASVAKSATAAAAAADMVNVAVTKVSATELTTAVYVNGVTAAKRDVTYSAQSAGRLEYLGADIGDMVKRETVLARVDYSTQQAQQQQAKASYELAKATHSRMEILGADLVSAQKLDESKFAMYGAKANLDLAAANAANAVVRADSRGEVAMKYVEKGEFVTPGAPLFRLVDTRVIVVEAAIPETQVSAVPKGADVSVRIDALSNEYNGTVTAIIPKADPASHTFTVRVEVNNSDRRILVGMSAALRIETETLENVLMIPQEMIIEGNGERYVFVVKDGKAIKQRVIPGTVNADQVVINDGLTAGDMLVTFGHRDLTDHQSVRIVSRPVAN